MNVINEQRSWRGEVDTHRGRKRGKGDGGTTALVGIPPIVLGANLDDVCEGIPYEDFGRPLAKRPMGIELSVCQCSTGQNEHQGEGARSVRTSFLDLKLNILAKVGIFYRGSVRECEIVVLAVREGRKLMN